MKCKTSFQEPNKLKIKNEKCQTCLRLAAFLFDGFLNFEFLIYLVLAIWFSRKVLREVIEKKNQQH
jgi:hypothetical protein